MWGPIAVNAFRGWAFFSLVETGIVERHLKPGLAVPVAAGSVDCNEAAT